MQVGERVDERNKECSNIYVVLKLKNLTKQRQFDSSQSKYLESLERVVSALEECVKDNINLMISSISYKSLRSFSPLFIYTWIQAYKD